MQVEKYWGASENENLDLENLLLPQPPPPVLSKPCTTGVSDSFEAPIISRISETLHRLPKVEISGFLLNLGLNKFAC